MITIARSVHGDRHPLTGEVRDRPVLMATCERCGEVCMATTEGLSRAMTAVAFVDALDQHLRDGCPEVPA